MIYKPKPYQELIADHIISHKRCAVWADMGMGKTSGTLYALDLLSRYIEDNKILVLAPKKVATSVWPAEVDKWHNFFHFKTVPIIGTAQERLEALHEPAAIHTINHENLPWLLEQVGGNWPWKTVVADESTRLKNFRLSGGKKPKDESKVNIPKERVSRARTLGKVAYSRVERFIELTGTPSPNGLLDLWGQLWFLDRGERLGRTYSAFKNRWFFYEHQYARKPVPNEYGKAEIIKRVSDICLSIRAKDWLDIKDPVIVDIPVTLPDKAMRLYKEMEKEMFIEILGTSVEAFNAAAKTMKCLQIANGAVYTDNVSKAWKPVHDAKLEALESIIEEAAGMPVLVAYHFKTDLIRLEKRFPQGRELRKDKDIDDWNAGKIPIMFVHPGSAGHGLNLQHGGNKVVMFGHWWDLEQYQQIIERIGPTRQLQSGYDRPVFIYNIRAVGTIDSRVIQSRTDKRSIQELLMEASKGYR